MKDIIKVCNLRRCFGEKTVLDHIDLQIKAGKYSAYWDLPVPERPH